METKNELIKDFGEHLSEDGKRPKTIESYTGDIEGFLTYMRKTREDFNGELKRLHVTNYRSYLTDEGYQPATINKKVNSLQAFNHFLIEQGLTPKML